MPKLYISEYASQAKEWAGAVPIAAGLEPALATQTVTIGGSSTQSAPFTGATRLVRIHADEACSIAFGENPVATTNSPRIAQNGTEYFGVQPGHRVAVISNT